eukprot:CAMPEP_0119116554 /NCGR_PEP_ID=MMETSP1180-20130426/52349_1 /TAXON_ID=3052 ORGANISM="Chlamydomonas cf sp, Strain CCMP681" /NCGR_SAMPLE_ID=MMETSP1180 /ASSEMBLY_ACC=CAM_ASM_000741 /LENGTH=110 /DNA_ID=CAMNT_0007105717 /DNA_START=519 /DNA_END=851 /DNA_ORIENTATION=-
MRNALVPSNQHQTGWRHWQLQQCTRAQAHIRLGRPRISIRLDGAIGSCNNAPGPRPTSGWDTLDVMPDMDMEAVRSDQPDQARVMPPAGPAVPSEPPQQRSGCQKSNQQE